ncbi:hypothetical protein EON82_19655 [bacterium]|nr:MAG: hypothetical protein EON82_19655 [bacterium]
MRYVDLVALLVVPDTNVFLHFRNFEEVPWADVVGRDDIVLVLLGTVVRELDKAKLTERNRDRARRVLSQIEGILQGSLHGVSAGGIPVRYQPERVLSATIEAEGLDGSLGDDRIFAQVIQLRASGADVVLVSDDLGVRLQARSREIRALVMPDVHRAAGSDPLRAENTRLKRDLQLMKSAAPRLQLAFAGTGTNRVKVCLAASVPRGEVRALELLDLRALPRPYRTGEREEPTVEQVAQYNHRVLKYNADYADYLAQLYRYQNFAAHHASLKLFVKNEGGVPAAQTAIVLHLPDALTLQTRFSELKEPDPPSPPRLPGRSTRARAVVGAESLVATRPPYVLEHPMPFAVSAPPNVTGPRRDGSDWIFEAGVIDNFGRVELPPFFLGWSSPAEVRNTTINFTLRAHNVPVLQKEALHVVVESAGA